MTLRETLGQFLSQVDSEQQAEGRRRVHASTASALGQTDVEARDDAHVDEKNIVRSTRDEQLARGRKPRKRAFVNNPRVEGVAESHGESQLKVPSDAQQRTLYLTVLLLAKQQEEEGFGPVVPHWKVMSELSDERFDKSPRIILQDLEGEGYVRQIITRKRGTLAWIPTVLDNAPQEPQKARGKDEHRSNVRRAVAAMEEQYAAAVDRRR